MQTFTGIQNLQIFVASAFGLDKKTWQERLDWFEANESRLSGIIHQAEEPALYHSALVALKAAKAGKPCGIPIALDATASGIQILAALSCCPMSARNSNVVRNGDRRMDAYTHGFDTMKELTGSDAKITRGDLKQAMMPAFYGSVAEPKRVFGKDTLMYRAFEESMETQFTGAWALNKRLGKLQDKTRERYFWIMPDGFDVQVKVEDTITETVRFMEVPFEVTRKVPQPTEYDCSISPNMVHSVDGYIVREISRMAMHDPVRVERIKDAIGSSSTHGARTHHGKMVQYLTVLHQRTGMLSARILDHLDEDNMGLLPSQTLLALFELLDALPERPFQVLCVHDCFRCHPNYGNDIRRLYNHQLMKVARGNLATWLVQQVSGSNDTVEKIDPDLWMEIPDTDYSLS